MGLHYKLAVGQMYNQYLADTVSKGPLTADAYVAALMSEGKKAISKTIFEIYSPSFDVIDTNGDGHMYLCDGVPGLL